MTVITATLLLFGGASFGQASTARLSVSIRQTVPADEAMEIEVAITNAGDESARKPKVTLTVGDWSQDREGLTDIAAKGDVRFVTRLTAPAPLLPGRYLLAVRVDYEDRKGRSHRVYHFASCYVGQPRDLLVHSRLLAYVAEPLRFHPLKFWKKDASMLVRLRNDWDTPVTAHLALFLPAGYRGVDPEKQTISVPQGTVGSVTLRVAADHGLLSAGDKGKNMGLVVWYEQEGHRFAQEIPALSLFQEEKITYLPIYLLVGAFGFPLLWLWNKKSRTV